MGNSHSSNTGHIFDVVKSTLTMDELAFFLCRMNLDGDRELSFTEMGQRIGCSAEKAKKAWAVIMGKLTAEMASLS